VFAPSPSDGAGLSGVSCVSATFCEAAGYQLENSSGTRAKSLVEHWNGTSVRTQSDPAGEALAVSCASESFCMEVGNSPDTHGYSHANAARWNGTRWRKVALPTLVYDTLEGVSCWSRKGCIAVGSSMSSANAYSRPLVERWNGNAWKLRKAPTASRWLNHLAGISCVSGSACLAVGQTFLDAQGRDSKTLAEVWNGTRWRIVKTPTLRRSYQPNLMAVSCIGAKDCVAVGGGAAEHSLILHWTGSGFDRERPATPQGQDLPPDLSGVSCPTATFCMATGLLPFSGIRAEQWDGSHWTMVSLPGGGSGDSYDPIGVSCPTSTSCVAAGAYIHHRVEHVIVDEWSNS
jgi:putative hemolysin